MDKEVVVDDGGGGVAFIIPPPPNAASRPAPAIHEAGELSRLLEGVLASLSGVCGPVNRDCAGGSGGVTGPREGICAVPLNSASASSSSSSISTARAF